MNETDSEKFNRLEILNAQIDVWIDEENYAAVTNKEGVKLNPKTESRVAPCFGEENGNYITHGEKLDAEWRKALAYGRRGDEGDELPVEGAGGSKLSELADSEFTQWWSHLFYAKLLRAEIMKRGSSDCCIRRLDDVAAYLERHLPWQAEKQSKWVTRLRLMYLLELSAASQDWEALGFAERVRRIIMDEKASEEGNRQAACERAPYEFYELWAHYNIGIAYFHQGYYRKAVLEFNRIIWQVGKWEEAKDNKEHQAYRLFFEARLGVELLRLPAILYRAEVQLKLQFAYHALKRLEDWQRWQSDYKRVRAQLMGAEACRQMGRLDKSWAALVSVADGSSPSLLPKDFHLARKRREFKVLPEGFVSTYPGLYERYVDILIADHLDWLTLRGKDPLDDGLEIRRLIRRSDTRRRDKEALAKDYVKAVNDAESYLLRLVAAFSSYGHMVQHNAYNRRGYFQQLARYLAWLAKAADFGWDLAVHEAASACVKKAQKKVAEIANKLYQGNKENLLSEELELDKETPPSKEANLDKPLGRCHYCKAKGIDLRRLPSEHYAWFTKDMLDFFNKIKLDGVKEEKQRFVKRLIHLERKERNDLRIEDLKLRYEYYEEDELLRRWVKCNERKTSLKHYGEVLCWGGLPNGAEKLGLLKCTRESAEHEGERPSADSLDADIYTNTMKRWDKVFLHHLTSPSRHESQKPGFYFLGLQRWNSSSPAEGYSVGGGYLLYHVGSENRVDMGIAIDPGFDFVRNLFHMGFSLDDIDIVLISHAHLDHIRDFESIVMLLFELGKRGNKEKRVHVVLTLGAYKRLEHILESPTLRYYVEPYIIDIEREIDDAYFEKPLPQFEFIEVNAKKWSDNDGSPGQMERFGAVLAPGKSKPTGLSVSIRPTRAYHKDYTYSDSFGFVVGLGNRSKNRSESVRFGYTGDTRWVYPKLPDPIAEGARGQARQPKKRKIEDLAHQYRGCDVLLVHLGSLIMKNNDDEYSFDDYNQCSANADKYTCEKLVRDKDHPYLVGMLRLLSSLHGSLAKVKQAGAPLVLVSEFGEELRGRIRANLVQRLQKIYVERLALLPVDVGMNVHLKRRQDVPSNRKAADESLRMPCACEVWCVQCNDFVRVDEADFELYGADHALYCVCKTCRKATPTSVLQDRLRQLYEVGLDMRT